MNQLTKPFKPASKSKLIRGLLTLALITVSLAGIQMTVSANSAPKNTPTYQQQLQSEVDTANGTPRDGRNPARQTQTSLADAASQASGPGQRVDKPAAAVVGDHSHKVDPASVLPDTKKTGVLSGGCLLGYGIPGVQCIQVGKAGISATGSASSLASPNQPIKCDPAQTFALQGVQLNSIDNPFSPLPGRTKAACNITQL